MCLVSQPGVLQSIEVPADMRTAKNLFFLKLTARPGDVILRPPDGNSIVGFLGVTGESFDAAMRTATALAHRIDVTLSA
jgi:L-amino acid ligase C-terminal domain 2